MKLGIAPGAHHWGKFKRRFWGDYVRRLQARQRRRLGVLDTPVAQDFGRDLRALIGLEPQSQTRPYSRSAERGDIEDDEQSCSTSPGTVRNLLKPVAMRACRRVRSVQRGPA